MCVCTCVCVCVCVCMYVHACMHAHTCMCVIDKGMQVRDCPQKINKIRILTLTCMLFKYCSCIRHHMHGHRLHHHLQSGGYVHDITVHKPPNIANQQSNSNDKCKGWIMRLWPRQSYILLDCELIFNFKTFAWFAAQRLRVHEHIYVATFYGPMQATNL